MSGGKRSDSVVGLR